MESALLLNKLCCVATSTHSLGVRWPGTAFVQSIVNLRGSFPKRCRATALQEGAPFQLVLVWSVLQSCN